ncbi:MAG: hypothetical protein QF645_06150, partial [Planctomycetota bacterium]|nr:hypothetical protein [Planctomycetota bacterium]
MLSLALLLPSAPGAKDRFNRQERELEEARKLIHTGEFAEATTALRKYIQIWGDSSRGAEAAYLLAEAMEGDVRENPKATELEIRKIADQYRAAESRGYPSDSVLRGITRVANLLRSREFYGAAGDLYQNQL